MGCGLATAALLAGGCVLAPRRPAPPATPAPPAVTQDGPGPTTTDPTQKVDESHTFHKSVSDQQRFQVHLDFGRIFEGQGEFDRAVQEYQDALTVAETKGHGQFKPVDRALAHRRIAAASDRLGRFAQAEAHYKKALKLGPKDPKTWNDAGYSYYLQGRWAEAERALRAGLKLAPDDARLRTNLGMTLAAAGRSREALPLLGHAQGEAVGHANLGYLLAATGQIEPARQQYETALTLRPDLDLARRALAQLDGRRPGLPAPGTPALASRHAPIDPVDPGVMPASATGAEDIILPPPPPLPYPKLPSRTLP
jgi:tetratricopeptide (TPR) repeat protein